jgi:protein TonB
MTNNEILQADLLDIIFENRNKEYGAYALRTGYDRRLLTAIGAAMSTILLFILINVLNKKDKASDPVTKANEGYILKTIELPKPSEPKAPEKKPAKMPVQKTAIPVAAIKYVSTIAIKPDNLVKVTTPDIKQLDNKAIATITTVGKPFDGITKPQDKPTGPEAGGAGVKPETETVFVVNERDPEFPGGQEALKRFLSNNLTTPEPLESGEMKIVKVRFKIDKDGSVSNLEIINSGGNEFDREVLRVCKKMPRWKPAIQNGINVPVSYVIPVTFMTLEQ